jgi:hypothetical protein
MNRPGLAVLGAVALVAGVQPVDPNARCCEPAALVAAAQTTAPAPQPPPRAPSGRAGVNTQPAPPPPPPAPAPGTGQARAPRREGQLINIRVEATITDQQGAAPPVKKTLSAVVADGSTGSVRTLSNFANPAINTVPLNMDAEATLLPDNKLRLSLRLQYDLPSAVSLGRPPTEERQPSKTSIVESVNVVLENGKSIVAAQSADPVSDRQVVLEVKATVLR